MRFKTCLIQRFAAAGLPVALAVATSVALPPAAKASSTIDWRTFWTKARQSSPRVQVLKARQQQAASQLPLQVQPPSFAFGSMGMNGPFSETMERTFEVSQKLPFPTKFFSGSGIRNERIHQSELETDASLIDLKTEVYRDFVDLNELLARRQLVIDRQRFFVGHLKRLKSYTVSDQALQLHILEMDATASLLEADLKQLDSEELALRVKLGSWLSSDGSPLREDPVLKDVDPGQEIPSIDLAKSPFLRLSQSTETLRERERALARDSWLPDLFLTYRRRIRLDNVMPSSHELMVGLELPFLFPGQPSAITEGAGFARDEAAFENTERVRDLQARVESLKAKLGAASAQLKLMRSVVLPNLEKRMHLLHRLAQTDMGSLDLHRSVYEQYVQGQEKNLKYESDWRKARLELETIAGDAE